MHVEVEVFMHDLIAERVGQSANADRQWFRRGLDGDGIHQFISMKNNAASASSRITREIVCTTLEVVRSPTDAAVPCTWNPSRHPISEMTMAKIGALDM